MNDLIKNQYFHKSFEDFIMKNEKELDLICEKIGDDFYPNKENVLRFARCDLNKIKVIILGMDPYPSSYNSDSIRRGELSEVAPSGVTNPIEMPVATGRSFEVGNVDKWTDKFKQTSLINILKSLYYLKYNKEESIENIRNDIENKKFIISDPHEWFDKMENNGVMFLNATLTVKKGKPNSHKKIWKKFMDDVICYINDFDKDNNIIWLLWGKDAFDRVNDAVKDSIKKPKIIYKVHPASRVKNDFIVNNGFKDIKKMIKLDFLV